MAKFENFIVTNVGSQLFATALSEKKAVEFVSIVTSQDTVSKDAIPTTSTISNIKQTVPISNIEKIDDTNIKLSILIENTQVQTDYTINTIGIMAKIQGTDDNILYAISIATNSTSGAYVSAYNNITIGGINLEITLLVSNADNVTISVLPGAAATAEQFNQLKTYTESEFENVKSSIDTKTSTLQQNVTQQINTLKQDVTKQISESEQKVNQQVTTLEQTVTEQVEDLETNLSGQISSVQSTLSGQITALENSTNTKLKTYETLYIPNYTLQKAQWFNDAGQGCSYVISSDKITADSVVNIYMDLKNQEKLTNGYTVSSNKFVTLYSSDKPTEDVTINIEIKKATSTTL